MIARMAALVALAVAAGACGHAMFVPPSGPGAPAPDAAGAWTAATSRCRGATTYTAALRVSGRAGDQRIWPLAVDAALTADQSIYLGATMAGRPVFVLAGTRARATLWLRREHRVVVGPPADILETILGVSLPPDRLLAIVTGCVTRAFDVTSAASFGRMLAITTSDARVFLEPRGAAWQTRAGELDGFAVEYLREASSLPEKVWIRSTAGRTPAASLDIVVSEVELNGAVPASVFAPPAGAKTAAPMTLEELRSGGPVKDPGRDPGAPQ